MKNKIKRLVFISLMVSLSLVLRIVESFMPLLYFIAPGMKLGLTNIVSLTVLYTLGLKYAVLILFFRVAIASMFAGGISVFMFSIVGGLFSIVIMQICIKQNFYQMGLQLVSVLGAISFNLGQLFVASVLVSNLAILYYLPVMGLGSIGTGLFVGYVSKLICSQTVIAENLTESRKV